MENVNLNNKLEQIIKALIDLCAMTRELESSKDLFYTGYLEGIEKNKELEKENNELKPVSYTDLTLPTTERV